MPSSAPARIALAPSMLQLAGLGPMLFFGATPDLIPLVVAAVAIYAGSLSGAAMGFGTGFLLDLAVGGTMGVSSLVLTAVGYGVGRYREVRDPAHGLMPIAVGALATRASSWRSPPCPSCSTWAPRSARSCSGTCWSPWR